MSTCIGGWVDNGGEGIQTSFNRRGRWQTPDNTSSWNHEIGTLLPPQQIYAGKTELCLSQKVKFPDDWDVTFTETHWNNELSMLRYVDNVILPYVNEVREELPLDRINQKAIAIFDIFAAHRTDSLLEKLKSHDIQPLLVPAACTDKLQPLDVTKKTHITDEYRIPTG